MNQTGRARARTILGKIGSLPTGALNAITDVTGVKVGQTTLHHGKSVHTGVTAILPHDGSIFQDKVPAGIFTANGYGKLTGSTQVEELGEIETPILLTNTLAVPVVMQACLEYTLASNSGISIRSINALVGETNDSILNDITAFPISKEDALQAIQAARSGQVEEGSVGAGSGTVAFGWKGGIGTSSRIVNMGDESFTVGVLVQSNFGGQLILPGGIDFRAQNHENGSPDGSIMIIVATDAPLSDRNLRRLAARSMAGLARTGSAFSNGSGDYAIAFSTAESVRRTPSRRKCAHSLYPEITNDAISGLFLASIEATEEAILNSLFMATDVHGFTGLVMAIPFSHFPPKQ